MAVPLGDPAEPAQTPPNAGQAGEERLLISQLCEVLDAYLPPEAVRDVYRAYLFAAEAHIDQMRKSGEPYIYHPIAVARILAGMHMDHQTLVAAILHDVIEDTPTAKEHLAEQFGAEVAELVDGVSKLDHVGFSSRKEAQAENFRKMLLAMSRDVRVILIKLADRLHNMRTLGVMTPEKRRRIAHETLEIYAPIAYRLGMNDVRLELEDHGFRHLYPKRYFVIEREVERVRGHRRQVLDKIKQALRASLRQDGIDAQVIGREKHLYSVFRKMQEKRLRFEDVSDLFGFRVVTASAADCYRALGVVHSTYKPLPGKFKDYIAIPKANGYQSLHTVLVGPYGFPIEVQIRSSEMQHLADSGIAAHWHYKGGESGRAANTRAYEWLQSLLEMQRDAGTSVEFLDSVRVDLFPDETYVFTPAGDIVKLPRGATVLDFAFAVHSELGRYCSGARIDHKLVSLRTELSSGQMVEVLTSPNARPNASWLNFVVTAKARTNIRGFLKNIQRDEAISLGRRLLDRQLTRHGRHLADVPGGERETVVRSLGYARCDDLLADIGLGNRMAQLVARHFLPADGEAPPDRGAALAIEGTEGMVVQFARCCRPIPGDPVIGVFRPGRGLVVHVDGCANLGGRLSSADDVINLQWSADPKREFTTDLRIEVGNQRGVLARVASAISELGSNIENVAVEGRDGLTSTMHLSITVRDRKHMAAILRAVRAEREVLKIHRTRARAGGLRRDDGRWQHSAPTDTDSSI
ncbi:MAG: bifunctional (p)ppGpp synthetase/guanosine-3',5'-bis(diphosphate) 3'-pyrophosphohydrolase [Chromatiales bacterium]|nr:bifunctional (p)ppGpp synthetase/guanosine-3',5'-bis(diphosphate) 3'-pyrophosphohydrolase [Chromatiales bacterium]